MAILKNLLVNGASRFLGHVYIQDLDVAGATNFGTLAATNITASGTLAVTGATTLSSTLSVSGTATFSKTTDLSGTANNSPALIVGGTASQAHIEIDSNEIQGKGSGTTTADLYINNDGGKVLLSNSGKIYANNGTFTTPTLSSTDGSITNVTIANARVTDELIVDGVLETNEMRTNIIKAVGGQLYVAPTFVATNSTTLVCTAVTASTVSFTITDSTAINSLTYGGANWNSGSKLKFTAKITSNNIATNPPVITFSSAEGVLTSNMNATSGKLTFTVDYDGASTYFKVAASTNLTYSDMSVMMYQIKSGNDYFPVGIYIKSYGTDNKNSYIDVYGGTTAFPNARLGLLNGLKDPDNPTADLTINGTTVSGWGLMSSYAYLKGRIVSKSGTIGGWDIGATTLTSGTLGVDNSMWLTTANVPTATKFAGASSALSNWRVGVGSKFGVLSDGTMYCSNAIVSGNITATSGTIGGCTITNGSLQVPAANITGTLSADHIDTSSITIGQSQVNGLTTDLGNKASSSDLTTLSNKVTAVYGTCNTTASTAAKAITCSNFELFNGALVTVKFTTANTSSAKITLNVNSKGAKDVYVANAVTSASNQLLWGANAVITFRYDGSYFVVVGEPRNWYGASTTAASTAAKTDTTAVTGCVVCKGTIVSLSMTNDNTATSPTLNIQGTGAKALYAGLGTSTRPLTSNGLGWTAGSTTEFVFDGQYWRVGDTASLARAYTAQTTATDAATKATNYITTVTNAGIKVHDANNDSDYVQITSNGTYIYKGSNQMASFGTDILLGQESGTNRNIFIDADSGVNIKKGSTVLANYGDTITINHGTSGKKALTLDSTNGLQMYALNGTTVAAQLNASGLIVNTGIFGGSSGFTITTNKLYSNGKSSANSTNNGIYVQSGSGGGIYLGACDSTSQTCPFQVTADGTLNARNANISGDITATSGSIGSWTINGTNLEQRDMMSGTQSYYYSSGFGNKTATGINDSIRLWAGWIENDPSLLPEGETEEISTDEPYKPFYVTSRGVVHAASGSVFGNLNKAYVAIDDTSFDMHYGDSSVLHFGYVDGINEAGATAKAPYYSFGIRKNNESIGNYSFVIGQNITASGCDSFATGCDSIVSGHYSIATGLASTASGYCSTSMGARSIASGDYSTAIGSHAIASGFWSVAMGDNSVASGGNSIAMGIKSVATSYNSTVIGRFNAATRTGDGSTANPYVYTDAGNYAFIIGNGTGDATANRSNALTVDWNGLLWTSGGISTNGSIKQSASSVSSGTNATALGIGTVATNNYQLVIGKYNAATRSGSGTSSSPYTYSSVPNYPFIIGKGTGDATANRSNALTVDWNGNLVASGSVSDADGSLGVKVVDHGFVVQTGSGNNGTGTFTLSSAESSGYLTTNIVQIWPMGTWTNANATVAQIARSGSQITVTLASMSAQQYSVVAQVLYRG